ncbi:MAG: hypothetical protein AB1599_09220 [Planctomycetota bacterium]
MSSAGKLTTLALTAGIILLLCAPAPALTIQLKNGTSLTGEVVSSDEQGIEFKTWDNNGIVKLKWQHFDSEEASRIRKILSLSSLSGEAHNIDGHKIYLKSGTIHEGVVMEKTASQLKIKTITGVKNVANADILRMDPVKINPLGIYTAQEWYAEKAKAFNLEKAPDNYELAEYCRTFLKLYDKAKEHYLKAAELSDSYRERSLQKIAELDNDMVRGKEEEINKLLASKDSKSIEQAKEILANWRKGSGEKLTPAAEKAIRALEGKIKDAEKSLLSKSQKETVKKIHQQCYSSVKSLIKQIGSQEMSYQDTLAYVNTMMYKKMVEKLSKDLKMPEEEIITTLNDRTPEKYGDLQRREATYGDGSWVINAETQVPPSSMTPEEFAKYQKRIKLIADAKDKAAEKNELIAPEEWWEKAKGQRDQFLEALFAERYMYIVERKEIPCLTCSGEGVINKNLCKRCWGTMVDITIIYK